MLKSAVAILAIISAAFAAPPPPSNERIVGGSATFIEEYPYAGSMQLKQGFYSNHACGCALITSQSVVTAAHCLYSYFLLSLWSVRLGSTFRTYGGIVLEGSQMILHENYNHDTLVNDVAILKLAGSATFSDTVQPIAIAAPTYHIPDNSVVTGIGWGALTENAFQIPVQLQHVDMDVINQQICTDRYNSLNTNANWPYKVDDSMICSGILDVGGKDACQGDSGGPILFKTSQGDVLVGLISWGYGCAQPAYPGVSTRVSHFSDWIVQNGST